MIRRLWRWFLAHYRLNLDVVCEESKGKGLIDFHNYPDDKYGSWMCHMVEMECTRCGKRFTV